MSSSRIHCCYIIIGTEFKEKHILEQDKLFFFVFFVFFFFKITCFVVQSSALGLKKKKFFLSFSLP